ncbi:type IV secretion protein Rhs [Streptomyces cinnamoneus]|uniref:Type IV secretion protein Rhs n=1 Tax=Streptomyces cinnamoneus TaxID=53446 RepID=A0A2G1XEH6_STRCJ|nr:DUF6531 domain-containing protein [Streptomyces cinnamoneus]PHQ49637.1 type IV secretion protein Rhs [Streptomyces cinnamoneus]PPT14642.1 type IV secretion protein Rhs [Streptomyces cinnamoneus]
MRNPFGEVTHGLKNTFKKGVDKVGEEGEHLWDEGKKKVGEGVNWGAHELGKGLDTVGLHEAARTVDDFGDEFADDMGAHVGEKQLGQTERADELVHGSPAKIRSSASHLKDFSTAFDRVGRGMTALDASHWKGEGADAFREKFAMYPTRWARAAQACSDAAKALEAYAETVTWAQGRAKEAVAAYKAGKAAQKKAFAAYEEKVDAFNAAAKAYNAKLDKGQDPGTRPTPPGECPNVGADKIQEAKETLAAARRQRDAAAEHAAGAVKAALKDAPEKPAFSDRMEMNLDDLGTAGGIEATHFAGGFVKAGMGAVKTIRTVNPLDPYNLAHPAAYLDHVNSLGAGLVTLANHPDRVPAVLLGDEWGKDNAEASGRLGFDVGATLASGGANAGAAAGRRAFSGAARKGAEELGEEGARRTQKANPADAGRKDRDRCTGGDPVDLATGHMFLSQTDVSLPGALPLVFTRRVRSGYGAGRWLGPSWASTVDQRLEIDAEGVLFVCEDGRLLSYPHPAPGVPTLPSHGDRWPLECADDGGYVITDPQRGRTWHFASYDAGLALLEQVSDRNGHRITFEYDADGTPKALAHSAGYRVRVTTSDAGRVTALHLVGGGPGGADAELIRYGYTDGDLTEVVNSSGDPLRFTYDERRRITGWTDRNDRSYRYAYDDADRCVFQTGTEGHMRCAFTYGEPDPDTGLRVTTMTDSLGNTSRYTVNARSQVVAETDPTGATVLSRRDRHDRLLSRTDALGRVTALRYDEDGRPVAVVRPDGRESTATYNALGLTETVTGPDGAVWRQAYDEAGNLTSVTDPAGVTTHYAYDEAGHPASVTDALGGVTRIRCDAAGLPVEITDPLGGVTCYRRDAFGRVTTVVDPLGSTTRLWWTVEGRLARRVAPDGSEERWTYDGEGNCVTYTDPLGGVTRNEYTHFDLLTARTGPDGVRYAFSHDTRLQLRQVTNPQGLTWTYDYDPAGRLLSETDFDGRTLTYAHDAAGQLKARTNGLGQTVAYEHDVLGRVVAKDAAGAVTAYVYDTAGRLVEATGPDATLVYGRDRTGRVKSETTNGRTLCFAYDELGRRTRRVTPGGAVSTWTYDAAGRRTSLTASGQTFAMEHDAAGREVARHFGRGLTLTHGWDAAGRVVSQTLTGGPDDSAFQHRAYTYRRDGHLTGVADVLTGTRTFDLDAAGRVTAVHAEGWTERYAYDEAGNQTEATWPADHPGREAQGVRTYTGTRISRAGGIRYEHDAQGRVVLRQKTRLSRKPDTWRYEWDAEDRLRSVVTPDGTRWRYLYDPLGRRVAKQRLDGAGEVAEEVTFCWDGPTLAEQTTTSTALPHPVTLTWDHDGLRPVAQTERISAADAPQHEIDRRFFAIITDLVGTPNELIDETGTTAWRTRTTLWGTTAWSKNSTTYTPLRFPGQYFDPETGLHYNFHRHYDPETGRYASADPLGLAPAPNPVTYVHNPCTWADPLGLMSCPPKDVALGIRKYGLREFADDNGFTHYLDDWETWEAEVRAAAHNPGTRLHVVMDGFSGSTPTERFLGAYERGMEGNWLATEREMYHVGKSVRLGDRTWDSITFYENGKPVPIPEPQRWPMPRS